jgi:hypothetical protein
MGSSPLLTVGAKSDVLFLFQNTGRYPMSFRYEFTRAAGKKNLVLIFPEGQFENLPFEIRLAAPWVGDFYAATSDLKPADRWQLRHVGYLITRESEFGYQSARTIAPVEPAANPELRKAA